MRFSFRVLALLLCLTLSVACLPLSISAEALTEGDYTYTVNDDGISATITGYNGTDTELVIPSTLGEYKVTAIGRNAFNGYHTMTSVTLPSSVVSVSTMAFYNCSALASINVSPYLLSVGNQAFHGTKFLSDHETGPVYIGRVLYTYAGLMPDNTVITVKYGTASLSPYAFYGQTALQELYLPVGMRQIGAFAFMGCTGMLKLRVPPSVTTIGAAAFLNAGGNVSVYGVTGSTIDTYAEQEGQFFVYDETLDFPDGDVNRDNRTNSSDFRILMRMLLDGNLTVDEERMASCDLVYDGTVDSADIRALLRAHIS